jgi:putative nucleotidyltransferase with HDIG domain
MNDPHLGDERDVPSSQVLTDERAVKVGVWLLVLAVSLCGAAALGVAIATLDVGALNASAFVLAGLTIAAGRFSIKVPGRPATVSVSEVFVFASVLLFGPAPATITVALDGLWSSLRQRDRRLYRTLFNIAEPAVSTLAAGMAFYLAAGISPWHAAHTPPSSYLPPALAMTATYFLLNSGLQAAAVAIEARVSAVGVWRQHALYLAINYYAAASLATLAVQNSSGLNLQVLGLVVPLLMLSYAAYKAAASRIEDAHQHVSEVEQLYQATVETLAIAVDAKDQVTHGHIRRVQRHTLAVARALGVTDMLELKALEAASLLHDVGKLAVPDYVLNKPGALSPVEFDRIKLHAAKGAEILAAVRFPYPVVPIVRHHHEQWNGRGYPDGLAGEAIPLAARILTVVDCFDALTSDRPYRRSMTDEDAIAILRQRSGDMYDPRVVDAFITLIPSLRRTDDAVDSRGADLHAASADQVAQTSEPGDSGAAHPRPPQLEQVLGSVTAKLTGTLPSAEVCLFSPEEHTDALRVTYATPAIASGVASLRIRIGEGLTGWVAANRHTISNADAGLDLGDAAGALGLMACTATPVFAFGNLIGVLCVFASQRFTDAEVRTIGTIAQKIGLAVARRQDQEDGRLVPRTPTRSRTLRRPFPVRYDIGVRSAPDSRRGA